MNRPTRKLRPTGRTGKSRRRYPITKRSLRIGRQLASFKPRTFDQLGTRSFAGLPPQMGVKVQFQSDPRIDLLAAGAATPGRIQETYMFMPLVNMDALVYTDGLWTANWNSTEAQAMSSLYQEFKYVMTYVTGRLNIDHFGVNTALGGNAQVSTLQSVQCVADVVPLTYLRNSGGTGHSVLDFGRMFTGVDYYQMLTTAPTAKQLVLSSDTQAFANFTFKVDPMRHNGNSISGKSTNTNFVGFPGTFNAKVDTTVAYPSIGDSQQVLLLAFRWMTPELANFRLTCRASLLCDQHYLYRDIIPRLGYRFYSVGSQPDNNA